MIAIRPAAERGHADHGWLDTSHTFSFASYFDPAHMGFRDLRVINEDRVAGGTGFGTHPHRDMEIVTYVLSGALEHRDSMGGASILRPGDVQHMSAGTGVTHSEINASPVEPVHLLQIWLKPERTGLAPEYQERTFSTQERTNVLRPIVARDRRDGALPIHQDAAIYASILDAGSSVTHVLSAGRHGWLQVARGAVTLNGARLAAGDGAAVSGEPALEIAATEPSEILLFDLR
jgi:hypothetical protein